MKRANWIFLALLLSGVPAAVVAAPGVHTEREGAFLLPANPTRVEVPARGAEPDTAARPTRSSSIDLAKALPEVGGDDLPLVPIDYADDILMDVASNGDVYVGVGHARHFLGDRRIEVYRSQDGGTSFQLFGSLFPASGEYIFLEGLAVAEGTQDRVYVTYVYKLPGGGTEVRVAYEDLTATTASWTVRTVMAGANTTYGATDLAHDALSFSGYYLYVVSTARVGFGTGDGDDILFSRSTDFGNTWSAPYPIASVTAGDNIVYNAPQIAIGQGGLVHVVFRHSERFQDAFDDGVRYLKASNYASSSGNWGSHIPLYDITDGRDSRPWELVANPINGAVSLFTVHDNDQVEAWTSTNDGDFWALSGKDVLPFSVVVTARYDPQGQRVLAAGTSTGSGITEAAMIAAPTVDMSDWSAPVNFSEYVPYGLCAVAPDPSRGGKAALAWSGSKSGILETEVCFDAEWRGEDGWPNYAPGFPVSLPSGSGLPVRVRTPPAIVDLDGDDFDEIVFGDVDGKIHVLSHVGTIPQGWPQDVGSMAWGAPVAVGDLNGDGKMAVVAGATDGKVYAFDAQGNLLLGFPVDLGTNAATYVSIGTVGGPYPRWIFAASGTRIARISYRGAVNFKSGTLAGTFRYPPVIGDIDGDGDVEVVTAYVSSGGNGGVHFYNGDLSGSTTNRTFVAETPSDAISLGDLDFDGDLEICFPTEQGKLYVMHHDLSDMAGFPYDNGTGVPVTAAALDQLLGGSQPELLFGSRDARVHMVLYTGAEQASFPRYLGSTWHLHGGPIGTSLQGYLNWVTVGGRDSQIHTFKNVGATEADGWPRNLGDQFEVTPARGDLDKDGRIDLVFVGNESVHVIDAGVPSTGLSHPWNMFGANPQRSGCLQCFDDLATSVPLAGETRVDFRLGSENPARGSLSFVATLPGPGVVELDVVDLRGRRLRRVVRRSVDAGRHVLAFDGKDYRGTPLARGHYFARLEVRGSGYEEVSVRRFTLVD